MFLSNGIPVLLLTILLLSTALANSAVHASKDPFDSGYDHGYDDAQISDPSDRYINQPEKGPSFHTSEFMRGYDNGFNACSNGGSGDFYEPGEGSASGDRSRGDLIDGVCNFAQSNPAAAAGAASLLGYPGHVQFKLAAQKSLKRQLNCLLIQ